MCIPPRVLYSCSTTDLRYIAMYTATIIIYDVKLLIEKYLGNCASSVFQVDDVIRCITLSYCYSKMFLHYSALLESYRICEMCCILHVIYSDSLLHLLEISSIHCNYCTLQIYLGSNVVC